MTANVGTMFVNTSVQSQDEATTEFELSDDEPYHSYWYTDSNTYRQNMDSHFQQEETYLIGHEQAALRQCEPHASVIEIGCAGAAWAIRYASDNPSANVLAMDVTSVLRGIDKPIPENCKLISLESIDGPLPMLPSGSIGYVRISNLGGRIMDWKPLFDWCQAALSPGGWVEVSDTSRNYTDNMDSQWMVASSMFHQVGENIQKPFHEATSTKITNLLLESNLYISQTIRIGVPLSAPEGRRLLPNVLRDVEMVYRQCNPDESDLREFLCALTSGCDESAVSFQMTLAQKSGSESDRQLEGIMHQLELEMEHQAPVVLKDMVHKWLMNVTEGSLK